MLWEVRYFWIWESTWQLSHCLVLSQIPYEQWRVLEASTQQFTTPKPRACLSYGAHTSVYCKVTPATWTSPTTKCWNACNWLLLGSVCLPGGLTKTQPVLTVLLLSGWKCTWKGHCHKSKCYCPPGADGALKIQHKRIPFPRVAQLPHPQNLKPAVRPWVKPSWFTHPEPSCCARVGAEGGIPASPLVSAYDIVL